MRYYTLFGVFQGFMDDMRYYTLFGGFQVFYGRYALLYVICVFIFDFGYLGFFNSFMDDRWEFLKGLCTISLLIRYLTVFT